MTYVMHPEVMGRGAQITALASFLDDIAEEAEIWFASHQDVAAAMQAIAPEE